MDEVPRFGSEEHKNKATKNIMVTMRLWNFSSKWEKGKQGKEYAFKAKKLEKRVKSRLLNL